MTTLDQKILDSIAWQVAHTAVAWWLDDPSKTMEDHVNTVLDEKAEDGFVAYWPSEPGTVVISEPEFVSDADRPEVVRAALAYATLITG